MERRLIWDVVGRRRGRAGRVGSRGMVPLVTLSELERRVKALELRIMKLEELLDRLLERNK